MQNCLNIKSRATYQGGLAFFCYESEWDIERTYNALCLGDQIAQFYNGIIITISVWRSFGFYIKPVVVIWDSG